MVVEAEGIDESGNGFLRVLFEPLSGKAPCGDSNLLESAAADPVACVSQVYDPVLGLTWRVPVTSLQAAGFKRLGEAMMSNPVPSLCSTLLIFNSGEAPDTT